MKKAVIASILVGGMWGNIGSPFVKPVAAESLPTVQPATATANPNKLELLDAGVAPRRELKFRPVANRKQTMTMTMGMSMEMTIGETPLPQTPIPKMVFKIDSTVLQVDPSGDIHCNFTYSDVRAIADRDTPPELLAAMQKSFKNLIGIKIDMVIGSSGHVKSKKLILPKNIDPAVKQTLSQLDRSIEQLSTRLPQGMVGLGAKWRIEESLQISGIQFTQSSIHEIVAITETGMTIKSQIAQLSLPQDLPLPGLGKEIKAQITSLVSKGEGSYVLLFDSLLPVAGNLSINTDSKTSVQMSANDPPTNIASKIAVDLNVSSK
jgi:hypothetical protein